MVREIWARIPSPETAGAGRPACRCASISRGGTDSLAGWLQAYFAVEVTTAQSSRAVQRRDLGRFLRFMQAEEGSDDRALWTSRLSRAFLDALSKELDADGSRRFSDRTIARIAAHLKTFAKWVHSLRPSGSAIPPRN